MIFSLKTNVNLTDLIVQECHRFIIVMVLTVVANFILLLLRLSLVVAATVRDLDIWDFISGVIIALIVEISIVHYTNHVVLIIFR